LDASEELTFRQFFTVFFNLPSMLSARRTLIHEFQTARRIYTPFFYHSTVSAAVGFKTNAGATDAGATDAGVADAGVTDAGATDEGARNKCFLRDGKPP